MTSPRAGQPAEPTDLVNVAKLVTAYYELRPDPAEPAQRVAVRHLRPPRLALHGAVQRGPHPRHHPGHLRLPPRPGDRRPALPRRWTPTRSPSPRQATALEVLAANGVDVLSTRATAYTPTPARLARHPRPQRVGSASGDAPTASSSPRRTTRPTTAASSTTRPTAARPTPTSPSGSRTAPTQLLRERTRRSRARCRTPRALRGRHHRTARLPRRLRRRPRQRHRLGRDPRGRPEDRRRPARRRQRRITGRASPSATAST